MKTLKRKQVTYAIFVLILIVVIACIYRWRDDVRNTLLYGLGDWPTHEPYEGCVWAKKLFSKSGITVFEQSCSDTGASMIFSDSADELIGKWKTNTSYEFTLRLFQKKASQAPADIVKEWYAKLTLEQQTVCEI